MKIKLVTFPHKEGHHDAVLELDTCSPEDIFGKTVSIPGYPQVQYTVVVDGNPVVDWDDLLKACSDKPEPLEVVRFKPVIGG